MRSEKRSHMRSKMGNHMRSEKKSETRNNMRSEKRSERTSEKRSEKRSDKRQKANSKKQKAKGKGQKAKSKRQRHMTLIEGLDMSQACSDLPRLTIQQMMSKKQQNKGENAVQCTGRLGPAIFPQRLGGQPTTVPWRVAALLAAAASLKRRPSGAARMPAAPSVGRRSCAVNRYYQ